MNTEQLQQEFGLDGQVQFRQLNDETIVLDIENEYCSASIVMQGAHLTRWQPNDVEQPVIWLSEDARFSKGKSIRGGIPVCWPWFGPHSSEDDFPAHGHARTVEWMLLSTKSTEDGGTELQFQLIENEHSQKLWPHNTPLILVFNLDQTLKVQLITENADDHAVTIGEALHTYFHISDIESIRVTGLENCGYYDKVADARALQQGAVRFSAETDRVYLNTIATCIIEDAALGRSIHIDKSGSQSTVVWNPWIDKANAMCDLGVDGWRNMVCVETANAMENLVTIEPGEQHTISVEYSVEKI